MSDRVYLAGPARTPIGGFNGHFAKLPATQLGGAAIAASLERAGISPDAVDEAIVGNVLSAGQGQNVARQAALGAGLPSSCGATTINKMCGSSLRAIRLAAQAIRCGDASVIVAAGTENMTRSPYLAPQARDGYRMGHGALLDSMIHDGLWDAYRDAHMGQLAENCARKFDISRGAQDDYAIESYRRAQAAQEAGRFRAEIAPVEVKERRQTVTVDSDEDPPKFKPERVAKLRPAFDENGTITAANASSISDGAAAMLVLSEEAANRHGVTPTARLLGSAWAALEPEWFTVAPIHAVRKLCDQLSLKCSAVDLFEINEAFSVVAMAAIRELDLAHDKVNVHGGAVALGHPIGASGARIVVTLLNAMRIRGARIGIATACIGGGEAEAVAVELSAT